MNALQHPMTRRDDPDRRELERRWEMGQPQSAAGSSAGSGTSGQGLPAHALDRLISEYLVKVYGEALSEPVPHRFKVLLTSLASRGPP